MKVRRPDVLHAAVHEIRQKSNFPKSRFHFTELTERQRHVYRAVAQAAIVQEDLQYFGLWIDKDVANPERSTTRGEWDVKASLVTILLSKAIRREQVTVLIDRMPQPAYGTFEQVVLGRLRRNLGRQPITSMLQLDSRSCDGLQVADMFTSAMMGHEVRQTHASASRTNAKAHLVEDIRHLWNVQKLSSARSRRLSTERYRSPKPIAEQVGLLDE